MHNIIYISSVPCDWIVIVVVAVATTISRRQLAQAPSAVALTFTPQVRETRIIHFVGRGAITPASQRARRPGGHHRRHACA
jgi:hypothetical protein